MASYHNLTQQSDEMKKMADALNNEIFMLDALITQTKKEWVGPASDAFRSQLIKLTENLETIQKNMVSSVNQVNKFKETLY